MVDVTVDLNLPAEVVLSLNVPVTGIISVDLFVLPLIADLNVAAPEVEVAPTKRQASNLKKDVSIEPQDTGPKSRYVFIDIVKEFDIMKREGAFRWFGLRQPDYNEPCGCSQESTKGFLGPTQYCSRCMNTGYLFTDYLVKAATWESDLGTELRSGPGTVSTQTKNIVIDWPRKINKFDILIDLELRPDGKPEQPFNIRRYFLVMDSMPLFERDGRLAFWKGHIQERNLDNLLPNSEGTNYLYQGNRSNNEPY